MAQRSELDRRVWTFGVALPLVEQIDPALVSEYFWRTIALRPVRGDASDSSQRIASGLARLLAWYDRDVAAALSEAATSALERGDEVPPIIRGTAFQAWSAVDPRAAVTQIEKTPVDPSLDPRGTVRLRVAEKLVLPATARWREDYLENSGSFAFLLGDSY